MGSTSWIARVVRFAQSLRADLWSDPSQPRLRWAHAPQLRPDELSVRRLEPRRVLTASIQALAVPAEAVEGDTVEVSADATGGALKFDWTVTRDSNVIAEADTRDFSFQPTDDGEYKVALRVNDASDFSSDYAEATLTVTNARPQISQLHATPIVEGEVTVLTGVLSDPGADDTHTLEINWGDPKDPNNLQTIDLTTPPAGVTYNDATGEFRVEHKYLDNDAPGSDPDRFRINVLARDDDGGEFRALTAGWVRNAAPTVTGLSATSIDENGVTALTGVLQDPGKLDTHTLEINWGDPLSPGDSQSIDLTNPPAGVTYNAETGEFAITHQYLDDNSFATPVDLYTIGVTATDDEGASGYAETTVQVSNVAPKVESLSATSIQENGVTTLSGRIIEPGTQDLLRMVITWGDPGSPDQLQYVRFDAPPADFQYDPSTGQFSLTHQYLDDPAGTPDTYEIRVNVLDDDGGVGQATTTVNVSNAPPELADVDANDINENGVTTLTGRIVDAGSLDTFTLTVNWEDGAVEEFTTDPNGVGINLLDPPEGVAYDPATRAFSITHQYLDDNPTGTPSDAYTIRLTLVDDDADMAVDAKTIQVSNVAPVITKPEPFQINEGQSLLIGAEATPGALTIPGIVFEDAGTLDTHTATVNWGDGHPDEDLLVLQNIGSEVRTSVLVGDHTFADNGEYTVRITVTDDDGGQAVESFLVTVLNVDPELTGLYPFEVDEGAEVTLAGLGVGLTDPGFDNPLNTGDPANGGELQETFVGVQVDWGDGSTPDTLSVVDRVSGVPGAPTTAGFSHDTHYYADNGLYTVTLTVGDDDGGAVQRTFQITVNNVAPTLTLTDEMFVINEGQTLFVPGLGAFSDPGAANPLNPGGATEEIFHYTIAWGDEEGDDEGDEHQSPVTFVDGGAGVGTSGTLANSHFYADNDIDSRYTITVTLYDDDGGYAEQSFEITVNNVNPTIEPLNPSELIDDEYMPGILVDAENLDGDGVTVMAIRFSDPGADTYEVWIDWGDKLGEPDTDARFVKATPINWMESEDGVTLLFSYTYTGPPDPLDPAAPIAITAIVLDDDYTTANDGKLVVAAESVFLVEPGRSEPGVALISNPGIDSGAAAIDTRPAVEMLVFPQLEEFVEPPAVQAGVDLSQQGQDLQSSGGDQAATSERVWVLRRVLPNGEPGEPLQLKPDAMDRLPELFDRLPDGHYQILVIRTESNTERLVMDFVIRGGRPIDVSDDSDGARDRPPTEDQEAQPENPPAEPLPVENREQPEGLPAPVEANGQAKPVAAAALGVDQPDERRPDDAILAAGAVMAVAVTRPEGDWRRKVEHTLERANDHDWRMLNLLRRRPR
ncbi:PKD domain protein [Posidoniimonas polymericola]|uniref:PKD domain protein n=1 Tax=Posidoniimonas polymericola TaxID=2528002 RepID=A0A5C5YSA4_9BACT|nr:PKD domain-containing protein [Posidoniimonas polymericola]TWT77630.1 PKD domain protein [Posidoniimonas polymericola]